MIDLGLPAIHPKQESQKITTFIKSTFQKTNKKTAVVAVSGGIDSATTLALTTKALGAGNVHALLLPSLQSSTKNTDEALTLSEKLGIPTKHIHEINLAAAQEALAKTLDLYKVKHADKNLEVRLGNAAARLRMIFVYDQARALDALVVGTENRSEHLLAYFTRFGDEASDLEPIIHLYKTQVYALSAHLKLPDSLINKPPSAGLWSDQTDEKELGFSYLEADPILYQHFDKKKSQAQLIKLGFDEKLLEKIFTHTKSVEFKHHVPYHL